MAARLTRAKKKIVLAGIPLAAPVGDELRSRLDEVCRTIHLAFTAGYTPGAGPDLLRADLAGEAVRRPSAPTSRIGSATFGWPGLVPRGGGVVPERRRTRYLRGRMVDIEGRCR
jgi:hypothetical protein